LSQLFKGGGKEGSVLGAQRLLDQISQGPVDLPPSVTPEVLERYADIARKAISQGRDKLGVQALRLNAINELLKR
jgi:hypothetical protein